MANKSKYYKLEKDFLGISVYMDKDCFGYTFQVYDNDHNVGTGKHKNKFTAYRKAISNKVDFEIRYRQYFNAKQKTTS